MLCGSLGIAFAGRMALEILGAGSVLGSQCEELQTVCYMDGKKDIRCEITAS